VSASRALSCCLIFSFADGEGVDVAQFLEKVPIAVVADGL